MIGVTKKELNEYQMNILEIFQILNVFALFDFKILVQIGLQIIALD